MNAIHTEAYRNRVSFSVSFRMKRWQVLLVDGVNSDVQNFPDLFDALEWIKDQYRTAGVYFPNEFASHDLGSEIK